MSSLVSLISASTTISSLTVSRTSFGRNQLDHPPASESDYEFLCVGGEDQSTRFGFELQSWIALDVLPALPDAEGDLSVWRRSALRPFDREGLLRDGQGRSRAAWALYPCKPGASCPVRATYSV